MNRLEGWAIIALSLYMLAVVALFIQMNLVVKATHEERLEHMCEPTKTKWAFLAPVMEKNDVFIQREASRKEMCESRRKSDDTTGDA